MSIRPNFPNAGGFVLSYRWLALGVALGPPVWRGGFVLSYRWLASGVAFGRPVWRWFRLTILLVRVKCCFWTSRLTVVSSYPFLGAP